MKKVVTILLMGVLLITGVGMVFAAENLQSGEGWEEKEQVERRKAKIEMFKELTDKIHTLNSLRIEQKNLQKEVIEQQDTILDLYIEVREKGDKELLQEALELRKQVTDINQEINQIIKNMVQVRTDYQEAIKEGDKEGAQEYLDKDISLHQQINEKVTTKINLLKQIGEILA